MSLIKKIAKPFTSLFKHILTKTLREYVSTTKTSMIKNDLIEYYRFNQRNITKKSILLVELNEKCHGETIVGYAKYFHDIGYQIDVLLHENLFIQDLFSRVDADFIGNIYPVRDLSEMIKFSNSCIVSAYDLVFFNSHIIYIRKYMKSIVELCSFKYKPKYGYACAAHRLDDLEPDIHEICQVTQLWNLTSQNKAKTVNPHYFGEIKKHTKNACVRFVTAGAIQSSRKNFSILCDAIEMLYKRGVNNYEIIVIGAGKLKKVPVDIASKIRCLGRLRYEEMYSQIEDADYILTLLDPENAEHDRYIKTGVSGSFQLVYGFLKPCLIEKKFADVYDFTDENSFVYEGNLSLSDAMMSAINMSADDYALKLQNLEQKVKQIQKESLRNVVSMLGVDDK